MGYVARVDYKVRIKLPKDLAKAQEVIIIDVDTFLSEYLFLSVR